MNWASLVIQMVKNLPAMQETQVQSVGQEDSLEKEMATHSSILAWRIPWTEELAGYSPWGHKESNATEQHFHFFFSIWTFDLRKTDLALRFTSMLRSVRIFCYLFKILKWLQNKQRRYSKWWYSLRTLLFGKKFLMVSGFVSIGPADMTPRTSADFSEIPVLFFSRNLELSGRIWLSRWDLNRD